jgi:hypothetical protein
MSAFINKGAMPNKNHPILQQQKITVEKSTYG